MSSLLALAKGIVEDAGPLLLENKAQLEQAKAQAGEARRNNPPRQANLHARSETPPRNVPESAAPCSGVVLCCFWYIGPRFMVLSCRRS